MNLPEDLHERLEAAMADTSGIIVPKGQDEEVYFEQLRESIRASLTEPEWISASVEEPGFLSRKNGEAVSGILVAKTDGHWLIYEPNEDQYYCFWGTEKDNLGAFGVCGNPLYCWWE